MGKCEWCQKDADVLVPLSRKRGIFTVIINVCKRCFERHGGEK